MSQSFYGSICFTDLYDALKRGHSAFIKAESNGKIYVNINVWLNDQKDKYGNIMALQLNPTKERKDIDGRPYIGNCKASEAKPISQYDVPPEPTLPPTGGYSNPNTITEPIDDLPF